MAIITDGLVGYWHYKQGVSGSTWANIAPSTKGQFNGTLKNGAIVQTDGMYFDVEDDYAEIPIPTVLTSAGSYSIEVTIRYTTGTYPWLVTNVNGRDIFIHDGLTGAWIASNTVNNSIYFYENESPEFHQHHKATFTYNHITGKGSVYVNGELLGTRTYGTNGKITDTSTLWIGQWLGGHVAYLRLYDRELSASEVSQNNLVAVTEVGLPEVSEIVTDGLVCYWHYGQGVNGNTWENIAPATKGSYNGAITGTALVSDGMSFDGADDYVTSTINLNTQTWTYEFWTQGLNTDYETLFHHYEDMFGSLTLRYTNFYGTTLSSAKNGSGISIYEIQALATKSEFRHVVIVSDGASIKVIKNGVLDKIVETTKIHSANGIFILGAHISNGQYYYSMNGKIKFSRIYNRALSDSEIAQNYSVGTEIGLPKPAIITDRLVSYFHYKESVNGTTLVNLAPTTKGYYDGDLNGAVLQSDGIYFDGVNDYASLSLYGYGYGDPYINISGSFSLELSIKMHSVNNFEYMKIISIGNYEDVFSVIYDPLSQVGYYKNENVTKLSFGSQGLLGIDNWATLTFTYDHDTGDWKQYMNGEEIVGNRTTFKSPLSYSYAGMGLASNDLSALDTIPGHMSVKFVRFYDKALTSQEISYNYTADVDTVGLLEGTGTEPPPMGITYLGYGKANSSSTSGAKPVVDSISVTISVVTDGLVGYWHYASGVNGNTWENIAPDTIGQYNGALTGTTLLSDAVYFDSVNDKMVASLPLLSSFTVEVGYQKDDNSEATIYTDNQYMNSLSVGSTWIYTSGSYADSDIHEEAVIGTRKVISAVTFDGSNERLYNNNTYLSGYNGSNPTWDEITVGQVMGGKIVFVRVYNRALSSEELTQNYDLGYDNTGLGGEPPAGIAYLGYGVGNGTATSGAKPTVVKGETEPPDNNDKTGGVLIQSKTHAATGSPVTSVSFSFDVPVTKGNKILVMASGDGYTQIGYQSPMTITDNQGNTYSTVMSNRSYSDINHYVWEANASSSGSLTITITIGGTGDDSISIVAMEWAGVFGVNASLSQGNWQGSNLAPAVTTTARNTIIMAFCTDENTTAEYTPSDGYTAVGGIAGINGSSSTYSWVEYKAVTSAGTYQPSFTTPGSTGSWIRSTVAFEILLGSGTEQDPFLLTEANDFNYLSSALSAHYIVDNDIDATGWIHPTIMDFNGTIDGNGKVISNLTKPDTGNFGGLIGRAQSGALIKNLGLENVNVSGGMYTGAFIGHSVGGRVEFCYATGAVTGSYQLGGLIGFNQGGTLDRSYSKVAVSGNGSTRIAGLVGRGGGALNCYSTGLVTNAQSFIPGGLTTEGTSVGGYWDRETSGTTYSSSGTGLTTAQMKTQSSYVGWDFDTLWGIDPTINEGYPYLRVFETAVEEPPAGITYLSYGISNGTATSSAKPTRARTANDFFGYGKANGISTASSKPTKTRTANDYSGYVKANGVASVSAKPTKVTPQVPTDLRVTARTTTTITLEWTNLYIFNNMEVYYVSQLDGNNNSIPLSPTDQTVTVTGLRPGTNYSFELLMNNVDYYTQPIYTSTLAGTTHLVYGILDGISAASAKPTKTRTANDLISYGNSNGASTSSAKPTKTRTANDLVSYGGANAIATASAKPIKLTLITGTVSITSLSTVLDIEPKVVKGVSIIATGVSSTDFLGSKISKGIIDIGGSTGVEQNASAIRKGILDIAVKGSVVTAARSIRSATINSISTSTFITVSTEVLLGLVFIDSISNMEVNAVVTTPSSLLISGNGSVSVSGKATLSGIAGSSAKSGLSITATRVIKGVSDLSGSTSVSSIGIRTIKGVAPISSSSATDFAAKVLITGNASILGKGNVYAEPGSNSIKLASVSIGSLSGVTAGVDRVAGGRVTVNSDSTAQSSGILIKSFSSSIGSGSSLGAVGGRILKSNTIAGSQSGLISSAGAIRKGSSNLVSESSTKFNGYIVGIVSMVSTSSSTISVSGNTRRGGNISIDGKSTILSNGMAIKSVQGSSNIESSSLTSISGLLALGGVLGIGSSSNSDFRGRAIRSAISGFGAKAIVSVTSSGSTLAQALIDSNSSISISSMKIRHSGASFSALSTAQINAIRTIVGNTFLNPNSSVSINPGLVGSGDSIIDSNSGLNVIPGAIKIVEAGIAGRSNLDISIGEILIGTIQLQGSVSFNIYLSASTELNVALKAGINGNVKLNGKI
jgi:hypothetical protein